MWGIRLGWLAVAAALTWGDGAMAAKGSLSVQLAGVRCPSAEQLLPVLRARLTDRSVQLAKAKTARPLLTVELREVNTEQVLHVSLLLSDGRTFKRDLTLTAGQCTAAAETIGFLAKSWLEQVPLLSPEVPVTTGAAAAAGAATTAPSTAATVAKTKPEEGLSAGENPADAVPENLELPIVPRGQTPLSEEIAPPATDVPVVVVVGANAPAAPLPEVKKEEWSHPTGSADSTHLTLLLGADGAISGAGTYPSAGFVPTVELGLGPHWNVALSGRFGTKSSEPLVSSTSTTTLTATLSRTSVALLGGYEIFPLQRWSLVPFLGPAVEYWSIVSASTTGANPTPNTQALWQWDLDLGARGGYRLSRSWLVYLSFEISWFFRRETLEVMQPGGGSAPPVTYAATTPALWLSFGTGVAFDFF
jgi:hypothetical protein